jgi:hypothetical protein
MNTHDEDRMKKLLQQALPPVEGEPEPSQDLWPAMLRQLDSGPAKAPWYDWALGAGVVVFVAFFPGLAPVLLYYL